MKTHVINLLPFNKRTEMSRTEYVIKKVLAFILIFFVAGVLGEAVVIGLYTGMGYDPLHGVMPEGQIAGLIPYYGYILFSVIIVMIQNRDLIPEFSLQSVCKCRFSRTGASGYSDQHRFHNIPHCLE